MNQPLRHRPTPADVPDETRCPSHLYYNWSGTIRIPCVLKYASTLAKQIG